MNGHHDTGDSGEELKAGYIAILKTHEKKPVITGLSSRASFFMWRFCHFNFNWFRDRKGSEMAKKNIDTTTMGGRIQTLRLQKGWSQEELGFRIGVNNKSVISFYEHDTRAVSVSVLQVLAKELGTTMDYLANGTDTQGQDAMDPDLQLAIQLLKKLKTEKARKAAVEHIKLVAMME